MQNSGYSVPFTRVVEAVAAYATSAKLTLDAATYVSSELAVLLGQGVATIFGEAQSRPAADTAKIAPYARWHTARGNVVTNALHGLVQLTPEQAQAVKSGTPASAAQRAELMTLGLMV